MTPTVRRTLWKWRARVAALCGLAACIVIVLVLLIWPSWRFFNSAVEDLAETTFHLARAREQAGRASPSLERELEQAERSLRPWIFQETHETQAQARLQSEVGRRLQEEGLQVSSTALFPVRAQGPLHALTLQWQGRGSEAGLVRALSSLEAASPLMRVESIHIASEPGVRATEGGGSLHVSLRVVGYWQTPQAIDKARRAGRGGS